MPVFGCCLIIEIEKTREGEQICLRRELGNEGEWQGTELGRMQSRESGSLVHFIGQFADETRYCWCMLEICWSKFFCDPFRQFRRACFTAFLAIRKNPASSSKPNRNIEKICSRPSPASFFLISSRKLFRCSHHQSLELQFFIFPFVLKFFCAEFAGTANSKN